MNSKKNVVITFVVGCLMSVPLYFWPMEPGGPSGEGKGKEASNVMLQGNYWISRIPV